MEESKINEYCRKCGTMLDESKKCPMCGKQYFKFKKAFVIVPVVLVLLVAAVFSTVYFWIPQYKYEKAVELADSKNFEEANAIFKELGNYRDSKDLIHNHVFSHVIEQVDYTCKDDGYAVYECSCGESKKYVLKARHSYEPATCTEPKKCSACGNVSGSPLGHEEDFAVCLRCDKLLFEKQTYSGYGPGYIKNITLPYGEYTICGSHKGQHNFIVYFYGGKYDDMIANKIGKCSSVYTVDSSLGNQIKNGYIDVHMADGSWTFTIEASVN